MKQEVQLFHVESSKILSVPISFYATVPEPFSDRPPFRIGSFSQSLVPIKVTNYLLRTGSQRIMGFVSTSKLSNIFEKSESELIESVEAEEPVEGYRIWEWAEEGEDGTIYGFEVPQELLRNHARERDVSTGLLGF